jgi:pilus assembly protein TadC
MSITLNILLDKFNTFKDNVKQIILNKTTNVEETSHTFNNFIDGNLDTASGYLDNIFTDDDNNFIKNLGYDDDSGYTHGDVKNGCQNTQNKNLDTSGSDFIFDSNNHNGGINILNYSDLKNIRYDKDNNLLYLKEGQIKSYDLSKNISGATNKIYQKHICLYLLLKYYYNNKLKDDNDIDITKYSIFLSDEITPDSNINGYLTLFKAELKDSDGNNLKNRNDYIVILYHYYNVFITLINYKIIYEFIITNCNIHHTINSGDFEDKYINYCDWENLIIKEEAKKCENVDIPTKIPTFDKSNNCKVNFALYNADIKDKNLATDLTALDREANTIYNFSTADKNLIDTFNTIYSTIVTDKLSSDSVKHDYSPDYNGVLTADTLYHESDTSLTRYYKLDSTKNQLYLQDESDPTKYKINSKFIENDKCKDFDTLYYEDDDHQHENFYSSLKRGLSRKLHEDFQENLNKMNLTKNIVNLKDKENSDYNNIKERIENKEKKIKKTDKDIKENNKLLNSFNNKDKRLIYTYYITIIICFIILLSLINNYNNNMILSIIIILLIIYYILISYLNNINIKENFADDPTTWVEHINSKKTEYLSKTLYNELKEIRENNLSLINNIINVTEFKIRHETSVNDIISYTKYIKNKDNEYKNTLLLSLNNLYNLNDNLNSKGYDLKIKKININLMILLLLLIIILLILINLTKLNNLIMYFGIVVFIIIIGIYFYKIANIKEGNYRNYYWFSV